MTTAQTLRLIFGFNTQPPEGGWRVMATPKGLGNSVSTHSRPKAAGYPVNRYPCRKQFQHTAARRRLGEWHRLPFLVDLFQHTAARRRLVEAFVQNPSS